MVVNGGALQLQNSLTGAGNFTVSGPLILNGNGPTGNGALENVFGTATIAGTITLNTAATIGVTAGTLIENGVISGPGDLTKAGGGTLNLNAANTYTGNTILANGVTTVSTNALVFGVNVGSVTTARSTEPPSPTQIINGVSGGIFGAKTLILNGTGFAGYNLAGALVITNPNTTQTWMGNVVLNPGASIGVASGSTLILDGIVSGPGDLTKVGAGTLTLPAAETYTGNTVVNDGTLSIQTAGTILGSPNLYINAGTTLLIDNNVNGNTTSVILGNRIGATAGLTLNAGTLNFIGNPGTGGSVNGVEAGGAVTTTQTFGTLTLGAGSSLLQTGYTTAPNAGSISTLTAANLVRNTGATVNFQANSGGLAGAAYVGSSFNKVVFTAAPTTVGDNGGILPYAVVSNNFATGEDFATYDNGNNTIAAFSGYAPSIGAAGPNDTVKLTAAETLTTSKTINGLLLVGGTVGEAGFTLTLASGGLAATTTNSASLTNTVIGGTLAFGTAEGVINTVNNGSNVATLLLNSSTTGSGGLTVGGTGINTLPSSSTVTGSSTLAGGTLNLGNGSALGTGTLNLISAIIQGLAAIIVPNTLVLNNSTLTIAGNQNLFFTGNATLSDTNTAAGTFTNTLIVTSTAVTQFSGNLGGSGSLTIGNTGSLTAYSNGTVALSGTNTYSGGTYVAGPTFYNLNTGSPGSLNSPYGTVANGPTVVVGSNSAFGTGTLTLGGATILSDANGHILTNALVFNGPVIFGGSSFGGTSATNGNLILSGNGLLTGLNLVQTLNTTTLSGNLSGPGGIVAAGAGTLILTGTNTFTGGAVLNSAGGGIPVDFINTGGAATMNAVPFNTATPITARVDGVIYYPNSTGFTTNGGNVVPSNVPSTNVAGLWTGYIDIVAPGTYTFGLNSGAGSQLLVDGQIVVDNDGRHPLAAGPTTATINLTAGLHSFQVKYFQTNLAGAGILVLYQGPDTGNQLIPIPSSALSTSLGTAGTLQIASAAALGSGPIELSNGVLQANAAVTFTNPVAFTGGPLPLVLTGSNMSFNGANVLTSTTSLATANTLVGNTALSINSGTTVTLTGDLAGTAGLTLTNQPVIAGTTTYTGGGTLVVNAPLTYSGPTTVSSGTLSVGGASGNGALVNTTATSAVQNFNILGATGGTFTLTFNGYTTAALAYNVSLTGGPTATASLQNALNALPSIAGVNGSVTVTGTVTTNYLITFGGALAGTAVPLLTYNLAGLSGGTNVKAQVATMTGGSPGLTINSGGTVTLDNTVANNPNRLNATATVALNGGTLNVFGTNNAATTATLGALTLASGSSTINSVAGSGTGTIVVTAASLTRNVGATVNFTGANLGSASNQIIFTTPPTLTGTTQPAGTGLLPYATVNGTELATYGTTGVITYTGTGTAYSTTVSGAGRFRERQPGGERHRHGPPGH